MGTKSQSSHEHLVLLCAESVFMLLDSNSKRRLILALVTDKNEHNIVAYINITGPICDFRNHLRLRTNTTCVVENQPSIVYIWLPN